MSSPFSLDFLLVMQCWQENARLCEEVERLRAELAEAKKAKGRLKRENRRLQRNSCKSNF